MPGWGDMRRAVERVTHRVFGERATIRAPGGADRRVVGVLRQGAEAATIADEVGYEATDVTYEIRKAADGGPWSVDDFPVQTVLTLDSGASFVVMYAAQTDTRIALGLAPVE